MAYKNHSTIKMFTNIEIKLHKPKNTMELANSSNVCKYLNRAIYQ